jgi:hypothetical protein
VNLTGGAPPPQLQFGIPARLWRGRIPPAPTFRSPTPSLRERNDSGRLAGKKLRGQACKPNFVSPGEPEEGDHSSRPDIAIGLERPTRGLPVADLLPEVREPKRDVAGRAAPPLLFGLAPCGVCRAPDVAIGAVRSYFNPRSIGAAPFHPCSDESERYIFCGTFRAGGVRPDSSDIPLRPSLLASTLPCGVRTFLSPGHAGPDAEHRDARPRQRSPGLSAQTSS